MKAEKKKTERGGGREREGKRESDRKRELDRKQESATTGNFHASSRLLGMLRSSMAPAHEHAIDHRTRSAAAASDRRRRRRREGVARALFNVRDRSFFFSSGGCARRRLMPGRFAGAQGRGSLILCLRCSDPTATDHAAQEKSKAESRRRRERARASRARCTATAAGDARRR